MERKSTKMGAYGSRYAALSQEDRENLEPPRASSFSSVVDTDEAFVARTKRHSVFLHAAILGIVIIAALLGTLVWAGPFYRHHVQGVGGESSQASAKYVLDPHWEFDAPPRVREYHWTIKDVELRPDGVRRPMMTINGEFPGPMIECNQDDTIVVEVRNEAANSTSIHWHGIYQNGTNFMDGTVGITQCPIAPGSSMEYKFGVSKQSGTYWYHAHMAMQGSDGLFGPLVIHSKEEKRLQLLDYASDQVLMVHDHYHDLTSALMPRYLAPDNENAEPVPDGGLINGMNRRDCNAVHGRDCDSTTAAMAAFGMEANKNHRLRIINTGAFAEFQVKIDEHVFAVTEVDGTDVVPAYYHRLNIHPGQRYSIVVNTNVTHRDSFWLRAKMVTACFAEENGNLEAEVRAIVQYNTNAVLEEPQSADWDDRVDMQCLDMNTTELQPVEKISPPPADSMVYLRANFEIGNWRLSRGFFNSSSWRPALSSPTLHRMLSGHADSDEKSPPAKTNAVGFATGVELVYETSGIQTVDVLVSNFDDGSHPLHLHGYKYFVLASGHGYPPADLHDGSSSPPSNPLRRDTASVEAFGWILVRLVADNPGVWAFHCHIGWHTEAGMLMQFATRVDELAGGLHIPGAQLELCGRDGLERGASPPDSTWFGDFGGLTGEEAETEAP